MKILKIRNQNFYKDLQLLLDSRSQFNSKLIDDKVEKIINEVKTKGDKSLYKFS